MDTSPESIDGHAEPMKLRLAVLIWFGCIFGVTSLASLAARLDSGPLGWVAAFAYLAAGVYLNRVVLRRLITWHPVYSTLANVADEKVKMFLLWPLSYFFLFLRLAINRVL